jgi:hypothetical protein
LPSYSLMPLPFVVCRCHCRTIRCQYAPFFAVPNFESRESAVSILKYLMIPEYCEPSYCFPSRLTLKLTRTEPDMASRVYF